jgi:HD-GYP domain-containing protein (c-di-GMP phosphodiesterase class II)
MPTIRVKTGTNAGLVFEVGDAPLIVGRDDRAEIQVLDQGISRRHAEVFRIGEMYFIRDLDSRNGTYVNEERVREELLRDGDEVRIGSTILLFEDAGAQGVVGHPPTKGRVRVSPSADATTTIEINEALSRDLDDLAEPAKHEESRDLRILYRLSRVIAEAKESRPLLEDVVRLSGEAVRADHVCAFLRKEGSKEFELEASWQPEALAGRGVPVISTRVIQDVVATSRGVLSSDDKRGPAPDPRASVLGLGRPRLVMSVPIVAIDQIHGVLYCAAQDDPERFTRESLDLLTAIGVQAGIALQALVAVQRQERVLISAVRTLASAVEMRDPVYTGHSARVAGYCAGIAQALKISKSESRRIQLGALLHNIGEIVAPAHATGKDDESSRDAILRRSEVTETLIRKIEGLEYLLPVVRHYHERMDGSGFPEALRSEKIPLAARILAVADRLDTLMVRGDPPDFRRLSLKDALVLLRSEAPQKFDARVVDALLIAHRAGYLLDPENRIA